MKGCVLAIQVNPLIGLAELKPVKPPKKCRLILPPQKPPRSRRPSQVSVRLVAGEEEPHVPSTAIAPEMSEIPLGAVFGALPTKDVVDGHLAVAMDAEQQREEQAAQKEELEEFL